MRRSTAVAVLAIVVGACSTAAPGGPDSTVVSTVTSHAPTSSFAPATKGAPTTTTRAPSTTAPTTTTSTTTTTTVPLDPLQGLALEPVTDGLSQPTVVIPAPDGDSLLVAERTGRVVLVPKEGRAQAPFLEVAVAANGIEQGLLGLALHPSGERIFVYYVNRSGNRTLARYDISADWTADADSETVLFSLPQPEGSVDIRHYGGNLMFGPDGYLYVSVGDGADARGQGQDPGTVFGTILRVDVDADDPYGIPADNPFVAGGGAPEVWAYGLRNPWRFSIDPVDGLVYVADVGQETWEEVNLLPIEAGGANLGWPSAEGNHCFLESDCDLEAFVAPTLEYGHDQGCSITGGHVYRGSAIPELIGHYFYSDWCGGWIRSFRYADGAATEQTDWEIEGAGQVNAFGTDHQGELLIANYAGEIQRLVPLR
jgi:glucose/arabinose dehydrogenase